MNHNKSTYSIYQTQVECKKNFVKFLNPGNFCEKARNITRKPSAFSCAASATSRIKKRTPLRTNSLGVLLLFLRFLKFSRLFNSSFCTCIFKLFFDSFSFCFANAFFNHFWSRCNKIFSFFKT